MEGKWVLPVFASIILLGLIGVVEDVFAPPLPVINFDTFPDGTPVPFGTLISNQYVPFGAEFSSSGGSPVTFFGFGEVPPSAPNWLTGSPVAFGSITIDVVDPNTGIPTTADNVEFTLMSIGDSTFTVTAFSPLNIVIGTPQDFSNPGAGVGVGMNEVVTVNGPGIAYVTIEITNQAPGDGFGIDDVIITLTENQPPVADAGEIIIDNAARGETLILDASGSHDPDCPDDSCLTFEWDLKDPVDNTQNFPKSGSLATLTVEDTCETHRLELTVTDDGGLSDTDLLVILPENTFPAAKFEILSMPPFKVGELVKLDGQSSFDNEQDKFEYEWGYREPLSLELVKFGTSQQASFTPQETGRYSIWLQIMEPNCFESLDVEVQFIDVEPVASIELLFSKVQNLYEIGILDSEQTKKLQGWLDKGDKHLDKEKTKQADKKLGKFIDNVNGLITIGALSAAIGQSLIDTAIELQNNL